jgi:hypothetical protein
MTDDIVTRLRELANAFDDDDIEHDQSDWMRNAADEIKYLREKLDLYEGRYPTTDRNPT